MLNVKLTGRYISLELQYVFSSADVGTVNLLFNAQRSVAVAGLPGVYRIKAIEKNFLPDLWPDFLVSVTLVETPLLPDDLLGDIFLFPSEPESDLQ